MNLIFTQYEVMEEQEGSESRTNRKRPNDPFPPPPMEKKLISNFLTSMLGNEKAVELNRKQILLVN